MVATKCFVPGCCSGYAKDVKEKKEKGLRQRSMFRPPKDPNLLKLWANRIKRDDRPLTQNDRVCDLHFEDHLIIKVYETKMPDGSIYTIERPNWILAPGAVPSKFSFPQHLLPRQQKKRKPPTSRDEPSIQKIKLDCDDIDDASNPSTSMNTDSILVEAREEPPIQFHDLPALLSERKVPFIEHSASGSIMVLQITDEYEITKRIVIEGTMITKVYFGRVLIRIEGHEKIQSAVQLALFLDAVTSLDVCPNACTDYPSTKLPCRGFHKRGKYCLTCSVMKRGKPRPPTTPKAVEKAKVKKKNRATRNKQVGIKSYSKRSVQHPRVKTRWPTSRDLDQLPGIQAEVVRMIFKASKVEKKGMRYSRRYLYSCLLLKIKSPKAYNHLRRAGVLPLPHPDTISRRLRQLKPGFGFCKQTFSVMRSKAESMKPHERRGVIVFDEMKISTGLKFDKNELRVVGFTDLGRYTPQHQITLPGDHALVLIYQPFQGKWVQAIASFLSRGAAPGDVLSEIVTEAVIRLEEAGFYVDGLVCDGGSWNRKMFEIFGVDENEPSFPHPVDVQRRLWCVSDFNHLIKNVWTALLKEKVFNTPDGTVQLEHWKIVLAEEKKRALQLRATKLNDSHLYPKQFQKMSVARAYKFFSDEIADAMELYRRHGVTGLEDAESTIHYIRKISNLIKAFSSRTGKGAIYSNPQCSERTTIETFLPYLDQCNSGITKQTKFGLKLTCTSALQLSTFLLESCSFHFVMLTRLNQDNLERFFGMLRGACGSCDHPDAVMFSYVFKLMTTYSLVKPPKGSNVEGVDLLEALVTADLVDGSTSELPSARWEAIKTRLKNQMEPLQEGQGFSASDASSEIMEHVAGYFAMRAGNFKKCGDCLSQASSVPVESHGLIGIKDRFGALKYPSLPVIILIDPVDEVINSKITNLKALQSEIFFEVAEAIQDIPVPQVGCPVHCEELTPYLIRLYLTMRLVYLTAEATREMAVNKNSELRKMGKLLSK